MRHSMLLAAALVAGFTLAPSAAYATIGQQLPQAIKVNRALKKEVMGVTYYVQKGKVGAEYWSSELAGWDLKTADRLRAIAVGKAGKLRPVQKGEVVNPDVFKYDDGTIVHYNIRHKRVITMDVAGPGFYSKDVKVFDGGKPVPGGKWDKIADWKENPYQGKKW